MTDAPDFSLDDIGREGLIAPAGTEPAAHDGTGRVDLAFTVHTKAEGGVDVPPTQRGVRVPPGVTVFDSASWNGIAIDSTCGGHGTCHKCKVRVEGAGGPGRRLPVTRHDLRTFSTRAARRRLAARLPGAGHPQPRGRGPAAHDPAQGGDRGRRPAGDPAPRRPEAVRRARGGDARRPAHRPGPAHRRDQRPRADRRPARAAPARHRAAPVRLQGDRRGRRRGPRRRRARRHDRVPLRHRVRPRHHHRGRDPARRRHRHAARRGLDAQQAAAVRRRRDHPDQRDDDGPGHARPAPGGGGRDARRARPPGLPRGRRRPGRGLRGRGRRQRDDDRARPRHRPRAARRRAVRHVVGAARRPCSPPTSGWPCTRAPAPSSSRPSARTSAATSSPACSPPAWTATSGPASSSTSAPTARSCSATATRSSPPPRPPGRPSRAARSAAACAPPTARSR